MKVVVSSSGKELSSDSSPQFGRCPVFVIVDTESMQFESVDNPAANASGGAGVRAAQLVVDAGVQAVITGRVGPKAGQVLQAAGVPVHLFQGGTVLEAVEDYKAKKPAARDPIETSDRGTLEAASFSREEEIATLEREVAKLRKKLTSLMERVDQK
jgi:predicted Fe-Mo cluster-binding NifX family protein